MGHFSWPDVIQLCWFDRGKSQRTYKLAYMGSGHANTVQMLCSASSSNPVFDLAMSGRVITVHSYSLRSCRNYNNKMCKTKRLSAFVSVNYLDFLS